MLDLLASVQHNIIAVSQTLAGTKNEQSKITLTWKIPLEPKNELERAVLGAWIQLNLGEQDLDSPISMKGCVHREKWKKGRNMCKLKQTNKTPYKKSPGKSIFICSKWKKPIFLEGRLFVINFLFSGKRKSYCFSDSSPKSYYGHNCIMESFCSCNNKQCQANIFKPYKFFNFYYFFSLLTISVCTHVLEIKI